MSTFIIDCPRCKAKVAAEHRGQVDWSYAGDDEGEPIGHRVVIGYCPSPSCQIPLVGRAEQFGFQGYQDWEDDVFGDVVRVYPEPAKVFTSYRIPGALSHSLAEADRCLQVGANIAACVMLGRALEALCRDVLQKAEKPEATANAPSAKPTKRLMLGTGIRELRDRKIIDDRLYDWSVSLQAMRNLAAHPEDITVSREDAQDLQVFVNAITEYVYDLTDRYEEFKEREAEAKKPRRSISEMFSCVAQLSTLPNPPEQNASKTPGDPRTAPDMP
ncbi:DUF4145 domain-containing protein [Bradyrhizobium sp. AUGA SZCCT0240]|uniref:DUF4145 domain-containing protein n=1 Tax=unclassified Bradyrhizobium TaxID=2631580 RepID=UPI001BAB531B|nr:MULTISPECIES: DUF4145 domain-containing protein [unclassified Bradyrhizobium]MBR1196396.1 DUF4145 domain-containing protein [Bradyrhizobium sp. AUGA SZCCT0158]MBR1238601.1 DUF4145 domain-containing protein [Bradyrhizobium sp. AUGA SZCCT0274]MBR1256596.1 DUF4145 domain-containing protein [Bradyrhizobium sp. AUGA SZCCT0240]